MYRKVEDVVWKERNSDGTEDLDKGGERVFPIGELCVFKVPLAVQKRIKTARHSLNVI